MNNEGKRGSQGKSTRRRDKSKKKDIEVMAG